MTEKLHLNGACEFLNFFFLLYCFSKNKKLLFLLVILLYIAVFDTFEN